jgi:hypothetical protein
MRLSTIEKDYLLSVLKIQLEEHDKQAEIKEYHLCKELIGKIEKTKQGSDKVE